MATEIIEPLDSEQQKDHSGLAQNVEDAVDDGISSASSSDFADADNQRSASNESPDSHTTSEWEDILGSNELLRKVVQSGNEDSKVEKGDMVRICVEGELEDGTKVDCCDNLTFLLGDSEVISAFELCVPFMKVGEIDALRTSARFAYGKVGKTNEIPPGASISYTIELLSVESGPDFDQMKADELLAWVNKRKERGNYYFKREEYSSAIDVYNRAVKLLLMDSAKTDEERQQFLDAGVTLHNNLAAAQLKIEAWSAAVASLRSCTTFQPGNVKAHFRLGKAYLGMNDYGAAVKAFETALALDPDNKAIRREMDQATLRMKAENEQSKAVYKRMFRKGLSSREPEGSSFLRWWRNQGILGNASILAAVALTAGAVVARYFFLPKA